ncbi:BREX-1 system adenine-specific DNA-methyltransferase PglX [Staphylococcus equorum]|uniref:Eco57I restriction-modification methylase domain-containing protein n=1 Tax=Staphylococcus equorum TaxID=246432 RepID=UPI002DBC34A3|nr:N-6 DNA methylase [Staphylococcus equorum]MEB7688963.1 BREX-1 system adenine-specific DNA-methyltransferase PglX [Staphylococcus equorum]
MASHYNEKKLLKRAIRVAIKSLDDSIDAQSQRKIIIFSITNIMFKQYIQAKDHEALKKYLLNIFHDDEQTTTEIFLETEKLMFDSITGMLSELNLMAWSYQFLNQFYNHTHKDTQFFTENYMIDHILSEIHIKSNDKISDICCGGGNFLSYVLYDKLNTYDKLDLNVINNLTRNLYGYDIDSEIAQVAHLNILITIAQIYKEKGEEIPFNTLLNVETSIYTSIAPDVLGSLCNETKIYNVNSENNNFHTLIEVFRDSDIILTNPPFKTVKGMAGGLKEFLNRFYPDSNNDLCAAFLIKCSEFLTKHGTIGIVSQNSWMFLNSFKNFRDTLNSSYTFQSILDLGSSAFSDISGEKSSVALLTISKENSNSNIVKYKNLQNLNYEEKRAIIQGKKKSKSFWKELDFENLSSNDNQYFNFNNVGNFRDFFYTSKKYGEFATPMQGTSTGDNKKFVGKFWEHFGDDSWVLVSKGGGYSRWIGLNKFVVNWGTNGELIKSIKGSALRNTKHFGETDLVFTDTGTNGLSVRLKIENQIFIASGPGIRIHLGNPYNHLAFLNSRLASFYIKSLTPKLTIAAGYIKMLPVVDEILQSESIRKLGQNCVQLKTSLLSYRPNNFEYSQNNFKENRVSLKENARLLLLADINNSLDLMKCESEIDNFILNKLDLDFSEKKILDDETGVQPFGFSHNASFSINEIDNLFISIIDDSCSLKKFKLGRTRYGIDTPLEYLSRYYKVKPTTMALYLKENIRYFTKINEKYQNLILHNAILNYFNYDTSTGVDLKCVDISTLVEDVSFLIEINKDYYIEWLENKFNIIHKSIFEGSSLISVTGGKISSEKLH